MLGTRSTSPAIDLDSYVVAGVADHICPWQTCYRTTQLLGGETRFVLSTSGHIAAIVNPPGNPTANYRAADPQPARRPRTGSPAPNSTPGSWWPDYTTWLAEPAANERRHPRSPAAPTHPPQHRPRRLRPGSRPRCTDGEPVAEQGGSSPGTRPVAGPGAPGHPRPAAGPGQRHRCTAGGVRAVRRRPRPRDRVSSGSTSPASAAHPRPAALPLPGSAHTSGPGARRTGPRPRRHPRHLLGRRARAAVRLPEPAPLPAARPRRHRHRLPDDPRSPRVLEDAHPPPPPRTRLRRAGSPD